jgi:hypothetical protein
MLPGRRSSVPSFAPRMVCLAGGTRFLQLGASVAGRKPPHNKLQSLNKSPWTDLGLPTFQNLFCKSRFRMVLLEKFRLVGYFVAAQAEELPRRTNRSPRTLGTQPGNEEARKIPIRTALAGFTLAPYRSWARARQKSLAGLRVRMADAAGRPLADFLLFRFGGPIPPRNAATPLGGAAWSSSIRTEAAPALGSANDPQIQASRMTARLGKERVLLLQNEPNKGRRHRVHR